MIKYRNQSFRSRHESHFRYILRLYWHDIKDYFFGALSIIALVLFFFYG